MKILLVEDEKQLVESILGYLQKQGFICEAALNFLAAEDKLSVYDYDIVLLDINLPDGNGLNLLKFLKQEHPTTGILIVSAKNSLDDKIKGLDLGADDYITKPFHLAELNSRINAIIRRRNFNGQTKMTYSEIEVDPVSRQVIVGGNPVDLTKKEYDLLLYFIVNKSRVLTKEAIAEHIWGDNMYMADNFDLIYTHIKNLRKKLLEKGCGDYIKTVYGAGYKFSF